MQGGMAILAKLSEENCDESDDTCVLFETHDCNCADTTFFFEYSTCKSCLTPGSGSDISEDTRVLFETNDGNSVYITSFFGSSTCISCFILGSGTDIVKDMDFHYLFMSFLTLIALALGIMTWTS